MKTFLRTFVLMLTLMTGIHEGYAQNTGNGTPVILKGKPIEDGGGHKSPEVELPTVWFNSSSSILTFEGTSDLDYTPIYIYDDEDEMVYFDSLLFDVDGFCEFNLSALPTGDYVLVFELNGREYEGDFRK